MKKLLYLGAYSLAFFGFSIALVLKNIKTNNKPEISLKSNRRISAHNHHVTAQQIAEHDRYKTDTNNIRFSKSHYDNQKYGAHFWFAEERNAIGTSLLVKAAGFQEYILLDDDNTYTDNIVWNTDVNIDIEKNHQILVIFDYAGSYYSNFDDSRETKTRNSIMGPLRRMTKWTYIHSDSWLYDQGARTGRPTFVAYNLRNYKYRKYRSNVLITCHNIKQALIDAKSRFLSARNINPEQSSRTWFNVRKIKFSLDFQGVDVSGYSGTARLKFMNPRNIVIEFR